MANAAHEAIYAQHYNSVVQMAQKVDPQGRMGVSRPELIHALGISRTVADGLIARCRLRRSRVEGKTEYFTPSKATKAVLHQDGKENSTVTDAAGAANPADPKGLVGAIVGDDQPAAPASGKGKKGKNRLPAEDQTPQAPPAPPAAPPAPEAPVVAGAPVVTTPTVVVGKRKTPAELDEEIKAIRAAIELASKKAEGAFNTYVCQKAHAEALGERLKVAMTERLSVG